jgi:aryl-alcohol dehydrogenase-like predicted oxidoreductase
MEYRSIGRLQVSVVGLGCNNFGMRIDETASREVIQSALDRGVTLFDTADVYGGGQSESILGSALIDRPDVVVATKFGYDRENPEIGQCDPATIRQSARGSLSRLRRDRIELYQMHRPDPRVPIEETLGALAELQSEGLVIEIGCTGVQKTDLNAARHASYEGGLPAFVSVQNEYSMLVRTVEADVLPECAAQGQAFLPFFPLADGLLSGKYHAGILPAPGSRLDSYGPAKKRRILTPELMDLVGSLDDFARRRGRSLNQLAIAWLASRPAVASIIAGATTPDQVIGNSAASDWVLDSGDLAAIQSLLDRPGL